MLGVGLLSLDQAFLWSPPATTKRRGACFDAFSKWIRDELALEVDEDSFAPKLMSSALIGFGKHLFYSGAPKS